MRTTAAAASFAGRKRWVKWLQFLMLVVFVGEMGFLLRLDRLNGEYFNLKNFASINNSFFSSNLRTTGFPGEEDAELRVPGVTKEAPFIVTHLKPTDSCEEWLEVNDNVVKGRNFTTNPIHVVFGENQDWPTCSVGCVFKSSTSDYFRPDGMLRAVSGVTSWMEKESAHILRSMESASYYPENDIPSARRRGYDVVMTTSLTSDVPVGYFSWAEYDLMSPVSQKTESAHAAAFISNCGAHNFRLEALEALKGYGVKIDSYGQCLRTREGRGVNKLETLRRYMFSLAFENSNEDDYVTEKFWQSLVAGSVPVVVGAPNIANFAPAPNALLHIGNIEDVSVVAQQIKYLASNFTAYNETLQWKYNGPTDSFKALVDMAAVHSSCRLCIHLATRIQTREVMAASLKRPRTCTCTSKSGDVIHHIYVRERGRFQLHSVFLKSPDLTADGLRSAILAKFKSMSHVPVWWEERPAVLRGDGTLKIHTVYSVGLHQRDALYLSHFRTDEEVISFVEANPCSQLEVIFV